MTDAMSTEAITNERPGDASAPAKRRELLQLPGLAAIGLYLAALAGVIIVGVVGHHYPPLFLVFSVLFFAASGGLMLLFRWAWALGLAAVLLVAVYNSWLFSSEHLAPALVQALLNWVFFLYMIRIEVRSKLR
jgi:glycerol-3-phosphate acyltransferase PlsY